MRWHNLGTVIAYEFRRTALDLEQRLLRALPPRPIDRERP